MSRGTRRFRALALVIGMAAGGLMFTSGSAGAASYEQKPGPSGGWVAVTETECRSGAHSIQVGNVYIAPATGYSQQWVTAQLWYRNRDSGKWFYTNWAPWKLSKNTVGYVAAFDRGTWPEFRTGDLVGHRWDVVVRANWRMSNGTDVRTDLFQTTFINQYPSISSVSSTCYA